MILVTGAAGKTGKAVIRALVNRDEDVRAFVRLPEQRAEILELGALQVFNGDLGDRGDIERSVDGMEKIYHICPNANPHETRYADLLIDAAVSARVDQFGFHSVLHPQTQRMDHHWKKLRVEERLFESGLAFTIMQPCAYMQNLLSQRESMSGDGFISIPYSATAKFSYVDLEDIAAAIAKVLCEPGHLGAIYELAGPECLDHVQIAAVFRELVQRPIRIEQVGVDDWARVARRNGLGEYAISTLCAMFTYYDSYGFWGNSNVLAYLLGRKPTTLKDCLRRELLN